MKTIEIKEAISKTYTSDRYYKLFLFWWAMVGEGYVAADNLTDYFNMDDDVFTWELDDLASEFLKKMEK